MFSSRLEALHFCWSAPSLWGSIKGSYQAYLSVYAYSNRGQLQWHISKRHQNTSQQTKPATPTLESHSLFPCWDSYVAAFKFPSSKWAINPFCNTQLNVKVWMFLGLYGLQTPNWAHNALHLLIIPSSATAIPAHLCLALQSRFSSKSKGVMGK